MGAIMFLCTQTFSNTLNGNIMGIILSEPPILVSLSDQTREDLWQHFSFIRSYGDGAVNDARKILKLQVQV